MNKCKKFINDIFFILVVFLIAGYNFITRAIRSIKNGFKEHDNVNSYNLVTKKCSECKIEDTTNEVKIGRFTFGLCRNCFEKIKCISEQVNNGLNL